MELQYPTDGRFEPYDFETFKKYSRRLTKYLFRPEQKQVKIYYRKENKHYFVSLYEDSGGFHSCTLNESQFSRLRLISSKKYYLCESNKSKLIGSKLKYHDFYLEWVFSDYFSRLVESITVSFLVNVFGDYDFIDHLVLAGRAEINVSNYIYDLMEKHKKEIENFKIKNPDSGVKKLTDSILLKESQNSLHIFWDSFNKLLNRTNYRLRFDTKINQANIKTILIKHMLEVKMEIMEETESKKEINSYMSKIYAYGPGSATSKVCKKDFENFL